MHREWQNNSNLFVGHRQLDRHLSYNREGWAAITLHGLGYDKTEHWPQYGIKTQEEANSKYHWTEICHLFPTTVKFIQSLGFESYERVRIMKLSAGGFIMPHVDGEGRCFGPLNIAINNPIGCDFYFRKWGKVPFKSGIGFFLDVGNEHIVWNNSKEDRYHIIVHGRKDRNLYKIVKDQIKAKYEKK